jgi:hypothetical protein
MIDFKFTINEEAKSMKVSSEKYPSFAMFLNMEHAHFINYCIEGIKKLTDGEEEKFEISGNMFSIEANKEEVIIENLFEEKDSDRVLMSDFNEGMKMWGVELLELLKNNDRKK